MTIQRRAVDPDELQSFLRLVARENASRLHELLARHRLAVEIDDQEQRVLFSVFPETRTLVIGAPATCRLEAHAYAMAIQFACIAPENRSTLLPIGDRLLTWAVSRDLLPILRRAGKAASPADVIIGGEQEPLDDVLVAIPGEWRMLGRGWFLWSLGFVLLHELGHIELGHTSSSIDVERDADRYGSEWLLHDGLQTEASRLNRAYGIANALIWITVPNIYFGRRPESHPQPYDRLYGVLNQVAQPEDDEWVTALWELVSRMLFLHMENAGLEISQDHFRGTPKETASALLDLIAEGCRV